MKTKLSLILLIGLGLVGCRGYDADFESEYTSAVQTKGLANDGVFNEVSFPTSEQHRQQAGQNQSFYFEFDSDNLSEQDRKHIEVQAAYLAKHPNAQVRLEGNTDERGSREYNVALGWRRANSVANILRQIGATDEQVAVVSYGKEKPIADGHDEESYSKNRRVDLIYEAK